MTIQEKLNEYTERLEFLRKEDRIKWEKHLKYCENNKDRIPRPSYRNFVHETQFEETVLFGKIQALKEFI